MELMPQGGVDVLGELLVHRSGSCGCVMVLKGRVDVGYDGIPRLLLLLDHGCISLIDHAAQHFETKLVGIDLCCFCAATEKGLTLMISRATGIQSGQHAPRVVPKISLAS